MDMHHEQLMSWAEIAAAKDVNKISIQRLFEKHKIQGLRGKLKAKKVRQQLYGGKLSYLIDLNRDRLLTIEEMEKESGISRNQIKKLFADHGIQFLSCSERAKIQRQLHFDVVYQMNMEQKLPLAEITRQTGFSESYVKQVLLDKGIEPYTDYQSDVAKEKREQDFEIIYDLHFSKGLALKTIEKEFGYDWKYSNKVLREKGYEPNADVYFEQRKDKRKEFYEVFCSLHFEDGQALTQIANDYSCSASYVKSVLNEGEKQPLSRSELQKLRRDHLFKVIYKMHFEEKLPMIEIGKRLKISNALVSKILKENGIEPLNYGQVQFKKNI